MNKGKVRGPFHYPDIFLLLLGYAKVYLHLPYRQTEEGIVKGYAENKLPSVPVQYNKQKNKQNGYQDKRK